MVFLQENVYNCAVFYMKSTGIHDPLYGFISLPERSLQLLIAHPYLQRLRRITQLGLIEMVYPTATHTRFQHVLGTLELMRRMLTQLKKDIVLTDEEEEAALLAALLHDIGHGPFSHALEGDILPLRHEVITLKLIEALSEELDIDLALPKKLLSGSSQKPFLNELLAGHIDVDRMDYLSRDSFFTGVTEGHINVNRLLEVLCVADGKWCVKPKGIPTVEDFFHARRMMYLQVYRHKVGMAANYMLKATWKRARTLLKRGESINCAPSIRQLLMQTAGEEVQLRTFMQISDAHLWVCLQDWMESSDKVLSLLSRGLLYRQLFTLELSEGPFDSDFVVTLEQSARSRFDLPKEALPFVILRGFTDMSFEYCINSLPTQASLGVQPLSALFLGAKSPRPSSFHYLCYPSHVL